MKKFSDQKRSIRGYLLALHCMIFSLATSLLFAQSSATLSPDLVPKFLNALPVIKDLGLRVDMTKGGRMVVGMEQTEQELLGTLTTGTTPKSKVWGYRFPGLPVTYPGATIVAQEKRPVLVRWENRLPGHFLPVDPSLHIAHPPIPPNTLDHIDWIRNWLAAGNVPTVTHLHGGHTESASDGLPEAWFTQNFMEKGQHFVKKDYRYDNSQEAGTLWYHDHALGITRLNVYAGLAGFYLLRDDNENKLIQNNVLPSGDYEIEMVIQDRMFDTNGQLYFPAFPGDPAYEDFITGTGATPPAGPSVLAEFFGDIILVNGKAWPTLQVEPRKYRIRLLNGSDSRFYVLSFTDQGLPWFQIGTDDGFLVNAVNVPNPYPEAGQELIIAPGERMDLILDFSGKGGQTFTWNNYGPDAPFGGDIDTDLTRPTAGIMQFVVSKPLNGAVPEASVQIGTTLKNVAMPPVPANFVQANRNLVLFEGSDEYGRLQPLLGTLAQGSLIWDDPISENPGLNQEEVWEIFNATMDAHPIHLHLVAFQILGRGAFTGVVTPRDQTQHNGMVAVGGGRNFTLTSRDSWRGPEANELGWKDTHIVYPGEFSQLRAKFDRPGLYVWHCHILSHEDHEMMRPFHVGPIPRKNARVAEEVATLEQNSPNPFTGSTQIRFELKRTEDVQLEVFDLSGRMVYQFSDRFNPGKHALFWDGYDAESKLLPGGIYVYRLIGESFDVSKRLVIER